MSVQPFEIPELRFSLPAGGAISRERFVSVNSSGNAITATASTQVIGASANLVKSEELTNGERVAEIHTGLVPVIAGSAVTAGAAVKSDANGKAVPLGDSGIQAGIAITGATAANQHITVLIK